MSDIWGTERHVKGKGEEKGKRTRERQSRNQMER